MEWSRAPWKWEASIMGNPERLFRTRDREGTEALAEALGRAIASSVTVALDGELGAGKTAFVRGLARGLDVTDPVSSPTFTLLQEYAGRLPLRHFDAWMQEREEAFLESGAAELLDREGVVVVEWASRIGVWLPPNRLQVRLEARGEQDPGGEEGERWIEISALAGPGAGASDLEALLAGLGIPADVQEINPAGEPLPGPDVPPAT